MITESKQKAETKASVIICCYSLERFNDTLEAIASVRSQTLLPYEIIVVVDHNPELLERLKSQAPPGTKLVPNDGPRGLSGARNSGIGASTGNIIAFIDDDASAEKDWLGTLVLPFDETSVIAVGGVAWPQWPESKPPKWFPEELNWVVGCTYKGLAKKGNHVRNVIGCNMAFRKTAFDKAGLFRSETGRIGTSIGCGEETDMCLRISQVMPETVIIFEDQAIIHHKVAPSRLTWRYLFKRSYNEGFFKRTIKKLSTSPSPNTLSSEDSYLRSLLFKSMPGKLARFWKYQNILQITAILSCIGATGYGYLAGGRNIKKRSE